MSLDFRQLVFLVQNIERNTDFIAFSISKQIKFRKQSFCYLPLFPSQNFEKLSLNTAPSTWSHTWSLAYLHTFRKAFYFRDDRFHSRIPALPHQNTFELINNLLPFIDKIFLSFLKTFLAWNVFVAFSAPLRVCVFILSVDVIGFSRHLMIFMRISNLITKVR